MTCDSMDSRPILVKRPHSRSTSLRTSSGRSSASSLARSSFNPSSSELSPSPSSFWIAFICSRRYISRWRPPSSSLTLDWMSSCAERTSIWRWTWRSTRRSRSSTDRVSRIACFSADGKVEIARDQVGQLARLLDAFEELADGLLGKAHLPPELGGALAHLVVQGDERRVPGIEGVHLLRRLDGRLEAALLGDVARGDSARLALEQQEDAAKASLDRTDGRDGPDREQGIGGDRLPVVDLALRDREDPPLRVVQGGLDRAKGPRPAGRDREAHARKQNGIPHGNDRKSQCFVHPFPLVGVGALSRLPVTDTPNAKYGPFPRSGSRAPMPAGGPRAPESPLRQSLIHPGKQTRIPADSAGWTAGRGEGDWCV